MHFLIILIVNKFLNIYNIIITVNLKHNKNIKKLKRKED